MRTAACITDDVRQSRRQRDASTSQRGGLQTFLDGMYLEFLYPAQTLAMVRKMSNYDMPEWKCMPSRKVGLNTRKRRYTSAAAQAATKSTTKNSDGAAVSSPPDSQQAQNDLTWPGNTDDTVTSVQGSTDQQISVIRQPDLVRQEFGSLAPPGNVRGYDRAWQVHKAGGSSSQAETAEYLSSSTRLIDAERVLNVFQGISYTERLPEVYKAMIAALLVLGNEKKALEIHEEAKERRFQTSFGTNRLFAWAIDRKRWGLAFELWQTYWREIQRNRTIPVLWDDVVKLPHLIERALALASFIKLPLSQWPQESNSEFPKFASGVIRTAVFRANNPKDSEKIFQLITHLTHLKGDKKYYERAIMHFFQVRMTRLALRIYEFYRTLPSCQAPQRTMLDACLVAYYDVENVRGIQFVLNDWTRFYGGPELHTYRESMRYFARRGDAAVVETLFNGYLERAGRLKTTGEWVLLLQAYARQGKLRKTIDGFNEIESKFRLKPDQSCWNTLLYAYSKAEDVDGASRCLDDMRKSGLLEDSYTLGTLINMCGRRGDVEGVMELLDLGEEKGVEMTAEIYDGIILAHINNGDVDLAQQLAESAMSMNLKGSYTRMWNYVLHARAFQRRLDQTMEVFKRMQELSTQKFPVQPDHLTYATLIQAFVLMKQPVGANEILEDMIIPHGHIKVTALHYALVMAGYLRANQPTAVFTVFERMVKRGLKPTMNTNIALIHASVKTDKRLLGEGRDSNSSVNAEQVLEQVVANTDVAEIAGPDPMMWKRKQPISTAYPAAYFDFLIFVYGQQKAFDKVQALYEYYLEFSHEQGRDEVVTPPLRMLNALMMASSHRGDYGEVERCWKLATSEAAKQARKWNLSDTAQSKWVAPARRYLLAFPLTQYMNALAEQGRIQAMKDTVNRMLWDGYRLDRTNWNIYIQLLVTHGQYQEALGCCERELMTAWKGWREQRKAQGLPRLRNRVYDVPETARPFYKTMVYLARAVMDLESSPDGASDEEAGFGGMAAAYPRTMEALKSMPYRDDWLQASTLQRR